MFYYIEPEVAGSLGESSIIDTTFHPPKVSKLHYQFDGWLGDDLLETFPCYIVTEQMKKKIESNNLSGAKFDSVIISASDHFQEMYPSKIFPQFFWLKVDGSAGKSDFGIAKDHRLVISKEALDVIKQLNIDNSDIGEYKRL